MLVAYFRRPKVHEQHCSLKANSTWWSFNTVWPAEQIKCWQEAHQQEVLQVTNHLCTNSAAVKQQTHPTPTYHTTPHFHVQIRFACMLLTTCHALSHRFYATATSTP